MKTILTGVCALTLVFAGNRIAAAQEKSAATKPAMTGKTAKTADTVVSGKIETYEPGKSLTVITARQMSKSFDLEERGETVHVAPKLRVGEWVTVRQRTAAHGHKTLTVTHFNHTATTKTKKTAS